MNGVNYSADAPWIDFQQGGDKLDGTFPMTPQFVYNNITKVFRGRLPDVHPAVWGNTYNVNGATISGSDGVIFKSCAGAFWFPATGSMQPGGG